MSATTIMRALSLSKVAAESWSMQVDRRLCLGRPDTKHMSGGACTAILIDAMQMHTAKPVIQANVQFFRAPSVDETIEIIPLLHKPGRSIDIVSAQITTSETACANLMASFGRRSDEDAVQWQHSANVSDPKRCEPLPFVRADAEDLHSFLDVRMASTPQNGHLAFWVRTPESDAPADARFLALIADYLPEAIHFNLGEPVGATSLDNCFRMIAHEQTEWVLCDVDLSAVMSGVFHGSVKIFAQNGKLLAQGSQSGIVRALSK